MSRGAWQKTVYEDDPALTAVREQMRSEAMDFLRQADGFVVVVLTGDDRMGSSVMWPDLPDGFIDGLMDELEEHAFGGRSL